MNNYRPGQYRVSCDICGRNRFSDDVQKNWKNQIVCSDTCYEPRHPHDHVKVLPDLARPEHPRPDGNYTHAITPVDSNLTADDLTEYDGDPL